MIQNSNPLPKSITLVASESCLATCSPLLSFPAKGQSRRNITAWAISTQAVARNPTNEIVGLFVGVQLRYGFPRPTELKRHNAEHQPTEELEES